MLRRLFKGRQPLTHPDAEVRRTAIQGLDEITAESLAEDLARMLRDDPDPSVRMACLLQVRDRAVLESVLGEPLLGEAAAQRLQALSPGADAAAPQPSSDRLMAMPPAEAAARIRDIEDIDELVTLALKSRGELRRQILEHPLLGRSAALVRLEKRSRAKDKSLNRHARTLLEECKRLTSEAGARAARARELAQALRRTAPAEQDRAWRERQHQLHARLHDALDDYRELREALAVFGEERADLEGLRSRAEDLPPIDAPAQAAPDSDVTDGAAPTPDSAATVSAGPDPFEPLVAGFRELDEALTAGRPFAELAELRQHLTDRWLTTADHQPPADAQHQVFEAVSHRFRELADAMERLQQAEVPPAPAGSLSVAPPEDAAAHRALWNAVAERRRVLKRLEQVRRKVRWPDWAPPTSEYAELLATTESLGEELGRADALLNEQLERLDEHISELTAAIDGGHLNQAQSLLSKSRALHDALPDQAVRAAGKRLGREAARLAELKDWQTFATSPKRQSLAEAMEALAQAPLEPRAQADRIKHLRREWQALGPVTQAADGRLADRFNALAEKAFETCRAFFAELAEERKANLAERRRICDQLERYLEDTDWARADMKAAERIMRAARDEWRRFHPVDRNPGKAVEAHFEKLQEQLHDRVKAEWDRNLKAKGDIIAEAEALVTADLPSHDKATAAKRLQQRWREVGITPRRPDQRLWQTFRSACDQIFAARDETRQSADAAREALLARLGERLDAFAAAVDQQTPEGASVAELKSFRQETAEIERLPSQQRRTLEDRRGRLVDQYRRLLDERQRIERREALAALARWDEAMTAAEVARRQGGQAAVPEAPAGAEEVAAARLACEGGEVPGDAARRLAVKAELTAGRASPPEDEPLRLEIQVERLQAGLSGGGTPDDPWALAEAWCRLGPKDDDLAPLRERLFAALAGLC